MLKTKTIVFYDSFGLTFSLVQCCQSPKIWFQYHAGPRDSQGLFLSHYNPSGHTPNQTYPRWSHMHATTGSGGGVVIRNYIYATRIERIEYRIKC